MYDICGNIRKPPDLVKCSKLTERAVGWVKPTVYGIINKKCSDFLSEAAVGWVKPTVYGP